MHFLNNYGLFLAKTFTTVVAIVVVLLFIAIIGSKNKGKTKERLNIKNLNEKYQKIKEQLQEDIFSKAEKKQVAKENKQKLKAEEKNPATKKRLFVLRFQGDLRASQVHSLRECISALLQIASDKDEVLVQLDSPGGAVPSYGLAASQLKRIREKQIPLTIAIDQVAASGGYMMACVGDRILAAPFAYIGSIGVVAQMPNFNRFLKKHDIDYEQITAGQYKRTLSIFGENTDEGRAKVKEEVEDIHHLFKNFILENRPHLDIETVATGEYWPAKRAVELNLVDELMTSDDYILNQLESCNVYELSLEIKRSKFEKFSHASQRLAEQFRLIW